MEFTMPSRRPSVILTRAFTTLQQHSPTSPTRSGSSSPRKLSTDELDNSAPRRPVISTPPRRLSVDRSIVDLDLRSRAVNSLTSLYKSPSTPTDGPSASYISPSLHIERNDQTPYESHADFATFWSAKLESMPDFQLHVTETLVDEVQLKVLVRSEITGLPNGRKKESVDMLEFSEDGVLVALVGSIRFVRDDSEEEDQEIEE